ncbi:putative O-methyltransferase [Talaromyces proteolyticus]|uniref:catechol O-methyltransferase n=1 Tax=Talaromyces proteolyticus TaxID=1131652 RepID=A0AAD4L4T8_9EURO|nr:putative O-methyltransferase [Talaromyces proteolyticus]KAH8705982.1 putative O-methyltransferase [Talaromyces proteolyticus]
MGKIDLPKREDSPHDDSRATDLLHYIFSLPNVEELRGHPDKILAAIDDYSENYKLLMVVGQDKGGHVVSLIQRNKPSTMVEAGAFVGYSAIMFGDAVRQAGGKQYISLEINPVFAAVSSLLVELAGLGDFVQILIAPCSISLARFVHDDILVNGHIDMLFIDHWQKLYVPDLWVVEQLGLLKPGVSTVVADNIIIPGAPEYLEWVTASPAEKRDKLKALERPETIGSERLIELIKKNGYRSEGVKLDNVLGNPNLIYETECHKYPLLGKEDALAVTKVVGVEK